MSGTFTHIPHRKYLLILSVVFSLWWTVCAINPYDRADWALENVLVIVLAIVIATSCRKFPLSRVSYTMIFIFLCLHEIGAHYTYSKVPYNEWTQATLGIHLNEALNLQRNHFDRLVHFLSGLLLVYPAREIFLRIANTKGFWGYFLPINIAMSTSMIFELFEWAAAEIFGGDLGIAYLGTQGDIWDAQKDMALASLGGLIAMTCTAFINMRFQRDFSQEWNDSLKIKSHQPLGEDEIERMLEDEKHPD